MAPKPVPTEQSLKNKLRENLIAAKDYLADANDTIVQLALATMNKNQTLSSNYLKTSKMTIATVQKIYTILHRLDRL